MCSICNMDVMRILPRNAQQPLRLAERAIATQLRESIRAMRVPPNGRSRPFFCRLFLTANPSSL